MAAPLTDLLRKDQFLWSDRTTEAFVDLKKHMLRAPVLAYPNFSDSFVIETNACEVRIGAVLMQQQHPIAFYSSKISPRMTKASTYANELYICYCTSSREMAILSVGEKICDQN